MRKLIYISCMSLILIILVGCNSLNTQEVTQNADESFKSKDFTEFNKQYNKLKKADSELATTYLNKLKEDDVFKLESYDSLAKIDEGIIAIDNINKNIPSLSDIAKTKSDTLKENKKYLEEVTKIMTTIKSNQLDLLKVDDTLNDINMPFMLINDQAKMDKVLKSYDDFSAESNSLLISLQDTKVPDIYESFNKNLIESMDQYKKSIEAKRDFIITNRIMITAVNDIKNIRNTYALIKGGELRREFKKFTNDIVTTSSNLKQRIDNFKI